MTASPAHLASTSAAPPSPPPAPRPHLGRTARLHPLHPPLLQPPSSKVVTRLDAKGAIDESHPLALGVVGVHGKPPVNSVSSHLLL